MPQEVAVRGFIYHLLDGRIRKTFPPKIDAAVDSLKNMGLDFFVPYKPFKPSNKESGLIYGEKVSMTWQCTRLKDGMCSDYENRPDLCKKYKPMSDDLCKVKSFKGIPIFYQQ